LCTRFSCTDFKFEKLYGKKQGNDKDFQSAKRSAVEWMMIPPAGPASQPFRIHQVIIGAGAGRALHPVCFLNLAEWIIKCALFCIADLDKSWLIHQPHLLFVGAYVLQLPRNK